MNFTDLPPAGSMIRVLITGMSGTGKSTVIQELVARGYHAIDLDGDAWSEWIEVDEFGPEGHRTQREWVWREDRLAQLLQSEDDGILFVSGCASNQRKFYARFDQIVLLSAPNDLIVERLATRTNNPFGKDPDELARVLWDLKTIEPLLRRGASLEIDTSAPLTEVVDTILTKRPSPSIGRGGKGVRAVLSLRRDCRLLAQLTRRRDHML